MYLFRHPPRPQPAPNPAETISPSDIAVKTAHGLSTHEWLALPEADKILLRLSVVNAEGRRAA